MYVEGDNYIAERAEVSLIKATVKLGIISNRYSTWMWHVGAIGSVQWMRSPKQPRGCTKHDPPWIGDAKEGKGMTDVEAILVQGSWPAIDDPIWSMASLTVAVRVHVKQRRRSKKAKVTLPDGWVEKCTYSIHHHEVGGVTDGEFQVEIRSNNCMHAITPIAQPSVSGKLGEALDNMQSGRDVVKPENNQINSSCGLLEWGNRSGRIHTTSIFRPGRGVIRSMLAKEKARVLDFPDTRTNRMIEDDLNLLIENEVPGKVIVASMYFLTAWRRPASGKRTRDTTASECEDRRTKRNRADPVNAPIEAEVSEVEVSTVEEDAEQDESEEYVMENGEWSDPSKEHDQDKATRSDGASIPYHLWNDRIASKLGEFWKSADYKNPPPTQKKDGSPGRRPATTQPKLNVDVPLDRLKLNRMLRMLRKAASKYWKHLVKKSFHDWFERVGKQHKDHEAIKVAGEASVAKAAETSWWEWKRGSTIFFWRWPPDYQDVVREGLLPMFDTDPPSNSDRQPPYDDDKIREQVKKKVDSVMMKGYVDLVDIKQIEAYMYMFHVPKGDDIRMVYDGSKSGLNNALWAPWFSLPTIDAMSRWVIAGSWLADNDYGDMFLNFPLHASLQKYCGIDLTQLYPNMKGGEASVMVARWLRNAMGLRSSPYASVQGALRAKHIALGDPADENNPFQWDRVIENLPGTQEYDPSLPWIMKMRRDGKSASDIAQYVDDMRIIAATKELAWQCSSRTAKTLCHLGLQDAARKRRPQSQRPGAWAGATIASDGDVVTKGVTQERWNKLQKKIRWIAHQVGLRDEFTEEDVGAGSQGAEETPEGKIRFKTTEQYVGFIVYVSMTYTTLIPYLKGIYLTLNSWRSDRDKEGWKEMKRRPQVNNKKYKREKAPKWVDVVPRLKHDMQALLELTCYKHPPDVPIRSKHKHAMYLVGDASGAGFGSSSWLEGTDEVHADFGNWSKAVTEGESSNFREAGNLVIRLKRMVASGELAKGSEVWVFTDNMVAERTYFRGSSNNSKLHQLILGLRKMEMEGDLIIHFVWIAGKRMIAQGTDGLSRGELSSGVMSGKDFLPYLPLNETAFDRDPKLKSRIQGWLVTDDWKVATTADWFHGVFQDPNGAWIWAPPPALAKVAVEQMCEAKHIFPNSKHVFVCPALMTGYWRKQLGKLADTSFTIKATENGTWEKDMFEPLTIAFVRPLLSSRPWKAGRLNRVSTWKGNLREMRWDNPRDVRNHMRKFWLSQER